GLMLASFVLPGARELPSPTTLSTLLPFGALVMAGLAVHDRVIARGEGLGLVLLFVLSVGAVVWDAGGSVGLPAWPRRVPPAPTPTIPTAPMAPTTPATPTGSEEPDPPPAGWPPVRRAVLAGRRLALTDDLLTPALAAGGVVLCVVGAF